MTGRTRFVEDIDFLRAAFDFGLSVNDGIKELVDNSLDNNATSIWVQIIKRQDGGIRLVVADDGDGIPQFFEDEGQREGIPYVMAFGGRGIEVESRKGRKRIGAFGYGLSQTITCLARERGFAQVWTRTQGDKGWRMSYYDYQDLVENDCKLPPEEDGMPSWLPPGDYGTIVLIDIEDSKGKRPGASMAELLRFMGRSYRHFLNDGARISIMTRGVTKEQTKQVRLKDPLALMEGSAEVEELGKAIAYDVPDITFDAENPLGEVIDPETGKPAVVRCALTRYSPIEVRKKLGFPLTNMGNPNLPPGGKPNQKIRSVFKKYGIGYNGCGFSVLRAGREIEFGKTLGIFTKSGEFFYMHGEVDFPLCLDHLFNVQTNKSRYSITRDVKDLLRENLGKYVTRAGRDHKESIRSQIELEKGKARVPQAEIVARKIAPLLPQPRLQGGDVDSAKEKRETQKAEAKKRAEDEIGSKIDVAKAQLESANSQGDIARANEAANTIQILEEQLDEWIERIEYRWNTRTPARIFSDELYSGEIYSMEDAGDEAHVTVNMGSEFGRRVYSPIESSGRLRPLVDMMLLSLGYAEFIDVKTDDADKAAYWRKAREEVSIHAEQFVRIMPEEIKDGDA